jgi:hypothetical protein
LVDNASEPPMSPQGVALRAPRFVAAAVLQLLMWLFTATIVDGNFRQVFYTCLLLGYWGGIWLIPQRIFPHGRPLGWLLAVLN